VVNHPNRSKRHERITIQRETLTDGSFVWNIMLPDVLHAVSEGDAENLANKIRDAIVLHTVDNPPIRYVEG
jgi:hypothetical protein